MSPHLSEEDLVLHYYGETDASEHLAVCAECRAESESLERTLSLCKEMPVPERSPEFGRDVWASLAPALDDPPSRRFLPAWHWWVAAAAAAFMLVAAYVSPKPRVAVTDDSDRVLTASVADHLDRVQNLLTEIANSGDADPARAADLVADGRLMRQSLAAHGETPAVGLLDEVDTVLTEAAHTPDWNDLRERIESGSLVFKVRVVESNLRNEEQSL